MFKRYTFWIKVSIVLMVFTAGFHSLSFLVELEGQNDAERTMVGLMTTHSMEMGAGFTATFMDLFNALSSCFSLVYLLGSLTLIVLLRKDAGNAIIRSVVGVQVFVFGMAFVIMALLTFLPPIVLTGLSFISLSVTYLLIPKNS